MSEKRYEIKFLAIELVSKSLGEPPKEKIEELEFTFTFLVDLRVHPERKIAAVITDTTILKVLDKEQVAFFKILCAFELPDFDQIFKKVDENKYDTPVELEILLKSTGLSTMRGIIYSELRGTYLQNAILPLIDIASLVKKNKKSKVDKAE